MLVVYPFGRYEQKNEVPTVPGTVECIQIFTTGPRGQTSFFEIFRWTQDNMTPTQP